MSAVRRISHFGWLLLMVVGIVLLVALYFIKAKASAAQDRYASLERQISDERQAISILRSEIAYLENPARLQNLAGQLLDLRPTEAEQNVTLGEAIAAIPFRPVPEASVENPDQATNDGEAL